MNGDTCNDIGMGSSASVHPGTLNAYGAVHLVTYMYGSLPVWLQKGHKLLPKYNLRCTIPHQDRASDPPSLPSGAPAIVKGDNIVRGEYDTLNEVRKACVAIYVLVLVDLCCCGIACVRNALSYKEWYLEVTMTLQNTWSISKQAMFERMKAHLVFTASHFYTHINYLFFEDSEVQLMAHDVLARNIDNVVTRECVKEVYKCDTVHNTTDMDNVTRFEMLDRIVRV